MKLRTLVKISITTSVTLLCVGFAVFFFLRLSAVKGKGEFELFTLVPPTATAVLETGSMASLMQEMDELTCSKEGHFLYVSRLFSYLKSNLDAFLEDTPHGLSRQMNRVLLSFHEPHNDCNQVLYCALGEGDYERVGKFIENYCADAFPSKIFHYKGEEIRIYPLPNNDFLACYFTDDFVVMSYQKRLVEEVIDTRQSGRSLLSDSMFADMRAGKKNSASATIYTRVHPIDGEKMLGQRTFGGWVELDMKLNGDAIYLSGMYRDADTCRTFVDMLRRQSPLEEFPGKTLPATTFFFDRLPVSDCSSLFCWMVDASRPKSKMSTDTLIHSTDGQFASCLAEGTLRDFTVCLFEHTDTVASPAGMALFSFDDSAQASRMLKLLVERCLPERKSATALFRVSHKRYPVYRIPHCTLLARLTGISLFSGSVHVCLYGDSLLFSPSVEALSEYVRQLEKGMVLEEMPGYKEVVGGLSAFCYFVLVADLEYLLEYPEGYSRLLPGFFLRYPDFFGRFILSAQLSFADGVAYPNLILKYK